LIYSNRIGQIDAIIDFLW